MKLSLNWLSDWTRIDRDVPALCELLTMAGLEVDGYESVADGLDGVVIGHVENREQHPNADKLSVCQVSDGEQVQTVVCGAPNAAAGLKVAYARPGAVLPNGMKLKVAKLRGVESHGMLCSAAELALGEGADGIIELPEDAPVGTSLIDYLQLDDHVVDVDLTPNRGDCLSVLGVARELATLTGQAPPVIDVPAVAATIQEVFPVELQAPASCAKYAGRIIRNVNATAPIPVWLSERLRRAGVRSISPVVDITNYVMLELGQPMHAFDLDHLSGGIQVRYASANEKLTLLDGQEVALNADTLVIADHQKPVALAGIMGGLDSGVGDSTQHVLLESAYFDPVNLAGVARQFRLHTDASHRFERGVDYVHQQRGIERATALILEICGGEPGPIEVAEQAAELPSRAPIDFKPGLVAQVLGISVPEADIERMFVGLGCEVSIGDGSWQVKPPSFRFDLQIPVDLVEEVARLHGYDKLGATLPDLAMQIEAQDAWRHGIAETRHSLINRGFFEAITYSFIDEAQFSAFTPAARAYQLENPISSDMGVMRASLLPGLVNALQHNQNRQQQDVRLFEIGRVFLHTDAGLDQPHRIAALGAGRRFAEHWEGQSENYDFYDIKQLVEEIISINGLITDATRPATNPVFHPGRSIAYMNADDLVAEAGLMHPQLVQKLGLKVAPVMFELALPAKLGFETPGFAPFSKFPAVRRDISIVLADEVPAGEVSSALQRRGGRSAARPAVV